MGRWMSAAVLRGMAGYRVVPVGKGGRGAGSHAAAFIDGPMLPEVPARPGRSGVTLVPSRHSEYDYAAVSVPRRSGRAVEGDGLENRYGEIISIEGSNPSSSSSDSSENQIRFLERWPRGRRR